MDRNNFSCVLRVRLNAVSLFSCRLQEILEVAEDMAIDIPHIWLYLAELITPMLHEGGIPMGQLFR